MTEPNKHALSPEYMQKCYTALADMEVELDANPLEYGPRRLNNKVAETRNMLTRCEAMALEVSERLHWLKRARLRAETALDLKVKEMMANDPEVRAGRSAGDREAIAHTKLIEERRIISSLAVDIQDAEALRTVVRAKRTDLKDVQGRLRDQRNLCMDEIGLGARWGSKPPPDEDAPELNPGKYVAPDADEIIAQVEGELHSGDATEVVVEVPEPEPEPVETSTSSEPQSEPEPEVPAPEPQEESVQAEIPPAADEGLILADADVDLDAIIAPADAVEDAPADKPSVPEAEASDDTMDNLLAEVQAPAPEKAEDAKGTMDMSFDLDAMIANIDDL